MGASSNVFLAAETNVNGSFLSIFLFGDLNFKLFQSRIIIILPISQIKALPVTSSSRDNTPTYILGSTSQQANARTRII